MWLTRSFAVLAGSVVLATCVVLALHQAERARRDILAAAERYNVSLTRTFANLLWPQHRGLLMRPTAPSPGDPGLAAVDRAVRQAMQGLPVVKVKIYGLNGLTTYSSAPAEIGADKRDNAGFQAARAGGVSSELQFKNTFNAFDGELTERDVLETYLPIRNAAGATEAVIELYQDLTPALRQAARAQREQWAITAAAFAALLAMLTGFVWRAERRLRQKHSEALAFQRQADEAAQRERVRTEFLANVSHELRSPMNAILGFAGVMQQQIFGPISPARYERYVDDIVDSGDYLLRTIDDILDMARIEAGQVELTENLVDVCDLAGRCVRRTVQAQQRPDVELRLALPPMPLYVYGDDGRLQQALCNLLSNAVKFTKGAGAVTVAVERRPDGDTAISVRDRGIGIAAEHLQRIEAPFGQVANAYAREVGGIGLGLPIAKALSELHGGRLRLDSAPGVGTTATIVLPAGRAAVLAPDAGQSCAA